MRGFGVPPLQKFGDAGEKRLGPPDATAEEFLGGLLHRRKKSLGDGGDVSGPARDELGPGDGLPAGHEVHQGDVWCIGRKPCHEIPVEALFSSGIGVEAAEGLDEAGLSGSVWIGDANNRDGGSNEGVDAAGIGRVEDELMAVPPHGEAQGEQ
jgi:hypothetical protein